jgi:hypothetical protein
MGIAGGRKAVGAWVMEEEAARGLPKEREDEASQG